MRLTAWAGEGESCASKAIQPRSSPATLAGGALLIIGSCDHWEFIMRRWIEDIMTGPIAEGNRQAGGQTGATVAGATQSGTLRGKGRIYFLSPPKPSSSLIETKQQRAGESARIADFYSPAYYRSRGRPVARRMILGQS